MYSRITNKKCPKCHKENVYLNPSDILVPPSESDLEEGKIIVGILYSWLGCRSCGWKGGEKGQKLYSEDIYI